MTTRVAIDLNVRVRGNQTYAGIEDVTGTVTPGAYVEVYEPETGVAGPAQVVEVDHEHRLVYLAVDWGKLRKRPPAGRQPYTWADTVVHYLAAALRQLARALESSRMARH